MESQENNIRRSDEGDNFPEFMLSIENDIAQVPIDYAGV
jgi:hypothetical protein